MNQSLLFTLGQTALRAKIRSDKAEAEGFDGSKIECENEA